MIFATRWKILCSTLPLLTSMDAVPVIPLIMSYLQSSMCTCAIKHFYLPFDWEYRILP